MCWITVLNPILLSSMKTILILETLNFKETDTKPGSW